MPGKHWTQEELEFLEQHVGMMMIPTLAKRISEEFGNDRTTTAVKVKLNKLGITNIRRETGRMTVHELAVLIRKSPHTIKRWIENGYLTAVKRTVCYKTKYHLISTEDFWEFAETHKDLLNFHKIEPNILLPEPEWVEEERKKDYHARLKSSREQWELSEDNILISMRKAGYSTKEIAERLGRKARGVQRRREKLIKKGLMEPEKINLYWRDEEIETMYELEKKGYTDQEIAYELGREAQHIADKRRCLRIAGKYKGFKDKVS